jgi:hypothetical protein
MSESADNTSAALRRRKITWVVSLWAISTGLIFGQILLVCWLIRGSRVSGLPGFGSLSPSPSWCFWGAFVPLGMICVALILQRRWFAQKMTYPITLGWMLMIPATLVGLLSGQILAPVRVGMVVVPDGRRFILASEQIGFDGYPGIYQPAGPFGMVWRRIGEVGYSDHPRFKSSSISFTSSRDAQWLLVARGGKWSECYRILPRNREHAALIPDLEDCRVPEPLPTYHDADYRAVMEARSRRIEMITGTRAPSREGS